MHGPVLHGWNQVDPHFPALLQLPVKVLFYPIKPKRELDDEDMTAIWSSIDWDRLTGILLLLQQDLQIGDIFPQGLVPLQAKIRPVWGVVGVNAGNVYVDNIVIRIFQRNQAALLIKFAVSK